MRTAFLKRVNFKLVVVRYSLFFSLGILLLSTGCTNQKVSGPVQFQLIHPVPGHCAYQISPTPVYTLNSVKPVQGLVGSVVRNSENLGARPEILDSGVGFESVDVQFADSGNTRVPLDFNSLFAISLYYAVEAGYRLFATLNPIADLAQIVPNFSSTLIVHDAKRTFGDLGSKPEAKDNAEYLPWTVKATGQVRNYIFSYPTEEVQQIPLGLNLGIMVHEYSHFVFHYLFYERIFNSDTDLEQSDSLMKPTARTLGSIDEGMADYFGFLATGDPGFFLCSFPNEDRDLSRDKRDQSSLVLSNIRVMEDFPVHVGGAWFAAVNYQIGQQIGFEENGRALINMMANLYQCPEAYSANRKLNIDFQSIADCHARYAPNGEGNLIRSAYTNYFGGAQ